MIVRYGQLIIPVIIVSPAPRFRDYVSQKLTKLDRIILVDKRPLDQPAMWRKYLERTSFETTHKHATTGLRSPLCAHRPEPPLSEVSIRQQTAPDQRFQNHLDLRARGPCRFSFETRRITWLLYFLGFHCNILLRISYFLKFTIALTAKREKFLILSLDISRIFYHYKIVLSSFRH